MEFYKGKTILVAGAAGFIGSNLSEQLIQFGASVIGIDTLLTGSTQNIDRIATTENFTFVNADVCDDPQQYLPSNIKQIDVIFHLASPASPVTYQKYPVQTYMANSYGTHRLLQFAQAHNPQARFLFASTSEVYGDPLEHPQKETYWGNVNPNGPRAMYDEAKRLGEAICGVHHRDFDVDVRIVRIFNTYGPRMDINDGRVIPDFIKNVLDGRPLVIHGDGTQTRSFCFVDDLVNGLLLLASKDEAKGQTVNIGNPYEMTLLSLIEELQLVSGLSPQLQFVPARTDDPKRRCPDISKAKSLLGWQPQISLKDGLQKTVEYFRTQRV